MGNRVMRRMVKRKKGILGLERRDMVGSPFFLLGGSLY